jgi:hypothetical protein
LVPAGLLPPDLDPIEEDFSKSRRCSEEGGPQKEALVKTISRALCAVTPLEIRGWFVYCRCSRFVNTILGNNPCMRAIWVANGG